MSYAVLKASPVSNSLVPIEVTSQDPNCKTPWNAGEVASASRSGFVISGNRIMTNAHVVSNARFLTVCKEGEPKPHPGPHS